MAAAKATATKKKPTKGRAKPKSKSKRAESNRRNSQKSTGPKSAAGKGKSRFNATKHGLTARSILLPGENPAELAARQREVIESFQPRNGTEMTLAERLAINLWRADRSDRSAANRLSFRLRHEPLDQAQREKDEAMELGTRLLWQPAFPLPISRRFAIGELTEPPSSDGAIHPHDAPRLRARLEYTIAGCDWLLERWDILIRRLNTERVWLSSDAFKMIRLMGKLAIDMADDLDVARVILCSLTLFGKPPAGPERALFDWKAAMIKMLTSFDVVNDNGNAEMLATQCEPFGRRLAELPLAALAPTGEIEAREWLSKIMRRQMGLVLQSRKPLEQIADADEAEAPERLAIELGTEGDKLRRYELANERMVLRTIEDFLKTRKMSETGVLDTHGLIGLDLEKAVEPVKTDEPLNVVVSTITDAEIEPFQAARQAPADGSESLFTPELPTTTESPIDATIERSPREEEVVRQYLSRFHKRICDSEISSRNEANLGPLEECPDLSWALEAEHVQAVKTEPAVECQSTTAVEAVVHGDGNPVDPRDGLSLPDRAAINGSPPEVNEQVLAVSPCVENLCDSEQNLRNEAKAVPLGDRPANQTAEERGPPGGLV